MSERKPDRFDRIRKQEYGCKHVIYKGTVCIDCHVIALRRVDKSARRVVVLCCGCGKTYVRDSRKEKLHGFGPGQCCKEVC